MARSNFGGTGSDIVLAPGVGGALHLAAATLTFWSAKTGGTQYTDLVLNGAAASSISVGLDGQIPLFSGPDAITQLWADAGGARVLMIAPGTGGGGTVVSDATTSVKGILKLASDSSVVTGTASDIAATPSGVKAASAATLTTWGLIPVIYYTSSWPARTVPSGYSGPVTFDSANKGPVTDPPAIDGDRWLRDGS